ncbi:MAG: DUF3368 domain-containing protein [Kiritimatiellae bacterium]|jgi:predicted nucleic acid-binding protein|nr:DUF3368 domain-containing protein [Kiritimatiellia bacterium]
MKKVVSNTSPISCLISLGRLDILPLFFEEVLIPDEVFKEWKQHPRTDAQEQLQIALSEGVLKIRSVSNLSMRSVMMLDLDAGESEAICLAIEQNADSVFIDEKDGRKMARHTGLDCKGTLWILSQAKKRGHLPSLRDVLNTLVREYAFALDSALIDESCKRVGEG